MWDLLVGLQSVVRQQKREDEAMKRARSEAQSQARRR